MTSLDFKTTYTAWDKKTDFKYMYAPVHLTEYQPISKYDKPCQMILFDISLHNFFFIFCMNSPSASSVFILFHFFHISLLTDKFLFSLMYLNRTFEEFKYVQNDILWNLYFPWLIFLDYMTYPICICRQLPSDRLFS